MCSFYMGDDAGRNPIFAVYKKKGSPGAAVEKTCVKRHILLICEKLKTLWTTVDNQHL